MSDVPYVFIPATLTEAFARLVMDLKDDVPGAILNNIKSAVYRAADEFFDFTNAWYADVDITLVYNQTSYTLSAPAQGQYNRLLVLYDSQDTEQNWVDRVKFIQPTGIVIATPPGQAGGTWVAKMALKPSGATVDGYPDIPDVIVQYYRDALYNGARRFLHMVPGKQYTDGPLAKQYGQMFTASKAQARINTIKANVLGQTNWAFPRGPFTRGSQRF